jgi:hypothetical protein
MGVLKNKFVKAIFNSNFLKHSFSCETIIRSDDHEFPSERKKRKADYNARSWILSWKRRIKPKLLHPVSLWLILILFFNLHLWLTSGLPFQTLRLKLLYGLHIHPTSAPCSSVCTLLKLFAQITFGTEWASSLCNFLNAPVTSFLSDWNNLLSMLFWSILSLCFPQGEATKFRTHTETTKSKVNLYLSLTN